MNLFTLSFVIIVNPLDFQNCMAPKNQVKNESAMSKMDRVALKFSAQKIGFLSFHWKKFLRKPKSESVISHL